VIPTPEEQPTVSVEEAGRWLGLGRSSAYEAARRGELPTLRFNGRTLRVPTARLRQMLGLAEPARVSDELPKSESDLPTATVFPMRRQAVR
jgi:excisionase family DNA binding protein